ncbi:hypothetical protein K5549_022031 [Capra hircus]|nr:hypothetical protein K5549_022031 [Capra hircus]
MGVQDPPQLLDLANQSLPWNEALAIVTLEELPLELFPPLFMVAFAWRTTQALNAVVQSRPFPCLHLGTLIKEHQPHLETFQAPLNNLEVLLAQGVQPRQWKLQLLNLHQKAHQDIWTVCSSNTAVFAHCWSPSQPSPFRRGAGWRRRYAKAGTAPVQLLLDLCLKEETLNQSLSYLLKKAK